MKRSLAALCFSVFFIIFATGCSTSYKVTPLSFKTPASFNNAVKIDGVEVAAKAFVDKKEAQKAFGFDILGAGMTPVQVVFDNEGAHSYEIDGQQTFLEDTGGNLWPILNSKIAYERATKYAKTKQIFKEGAYKGFLGAAAGSLIGAAVGIVSGEDALKSAGKGAAVGAAAGATIGGASGYTSNTARRSIVNDLRDKSLKNKAISPKSIAHGFLFFPGEAKSAKQLRLKLREEDTGKIHVLKLTF